MDEKNSYMDRILTVPYCCNNGNSAMEAMAMQNNNPWMYLVMLALFGNGGWGNNRNNDAQYMALSNQIADNNNNRYAFDAIQGNGFALSQLAQNLNVDTNQLRDAVGNVKDAIFNLGAANGMGFAGVTNSINLGNLNLIQQLKDCCCQQKELTITQGYQNQIQTINQTNDLQTSQRVENGLTRAEIASFRQAWENSRYQDVVAEKTRLQTELDLIRTNQSTQAYIAPLQQAVNNLTAQFQMYTGQKASTVQTNG